MHVELGPLYDKFYEFEEKWACAEAIDERKLRYRIELARILGVLARRMMQENRVLYPLADQAL